MDTTPDFDGATFNRERDKARLGEQLRRVYHYLEYQGRWIRLSEIANRTGYPEASISARIRDLRKAKFGGYQIDRRYVENGLWEYRLVK